MNRTISSGTLTALAIASVVSCSEHTGEITGLALNDSDVSGNRVVASITVSLDQSSVESGQTTQAHAVLRGTNGHTIWNQSVQWSSTNPTIATVSASGLVRALAVGTAVITASRGGATGSAGLTVTAGPSGTSAGAVSSVTTTLGSYTLNVGETTQASATTRDSGGNVLTGRTISWSSSNLSVASVTSAGIVTALAPGSARIQATSEGVSGDTVLTVRATSPPPDGSAQPPGMTLITERPFNSTTSTYTYGEAGWEDWSGNTYLTIVQDGTAPKSPSNVAQLRYPAGYSGGNAPGGAEYDLTTGGRRPTTLYVAMWVKLSSNWYGNPSAVNKICHIWIAGVNRVVASATGEAAGPLVPQIRLQGLAGQYSDGINPPNEDVNLNPNLVPTVRIVRGQWQKWEIVLVGGTAGAANGSVEWWINGVKVGQYAGIPYVPAGSGNNWQIFKWDPTWGGIGGTIPADQFMLMDHIYISGNP